MRPTEVYRLPATRFVATFIGSPAMNLLPGKIAAPGVVETGVGASPSEPRRSTCKAGQDVEVGIRPEDLRFAVPGAGDELAFVKDFVEELGATRLIHGSVGAAPLVVAVATSAQLDGAGALAVDPATVHLFDMRTGASLRRGAV